MSALVLVFPGMRVDLFFRMFKAMLLCMSACIMLACAFVLLVHAHDHVYEEARSHGHDYASEYAYLNALRAYAATATMTQ